MQNQGINIVLQNKSYTDMTRYLADSHLSLHALIIPYSHNTLQWHKLRWPETESVKAGDFHLSGLDTTAKI